MSSFSNFPPLLCSLLNSIHPSSLNYLRSYSKCLVLQSHIQFLSRCSQQSIIPKGFKLVFVPSVSKISSECSDLIENSVKQCSFTLMSIVLANHHQNLSNLVSETFSLLTNIMTMIDHNTFLYLLLLQSLWSEKIENDLNLVKKNKFAKCVAQDSTPYDNVSASTFISRSCISPFVAPSCLRNLNFNHYPLESSLDHVTHSSPLLKHSDHVVCLNNTFIKTEPKRVFTETDPKTLFTPPVSTCRDLFASHDDSNSETHPKHLLRPPISLTPHETTVTSTNNDSTLLALVNLVENESSTLFTPPVSTCKNKIASHDDSNSETHPKQLLRPPISYTPHEATMTSTNNDSTLLALVSLVENKTSPRENLSVNETRRGSRKRGKRIPKFSPAYFNSQWGDALPSNVVNLSSYNPNNQEKTILSLGLGFCSSTLHDPVRVLKDLRVFETRIRKREFFNNPRNKDIIEKMKFNDNNPKKPDEKRSYTVRYKKSKEESATEKSSKNHTLETYLTTIRKKTKAVIYKRHHFAKNLTPILEEAIKTLKQNKLLRITKADKGRKTVLIDVKDYIKMGDNILKDTSVYKPIDVSKDAIMKEFYCDYENIVGEEFNHGNLCKEDFESLSHKDLDGCEPATMYVLPKLHKLSEKEVEDKKIPSGRPIVSTVNSMYRKMDKFLADHMTPFINSTEIPDYLQDTPDLLRKIDEVNNSFDDNIPSSFSIQTQDVQSMYPSIKNDACIDAWFAIWSSTPMTVPPQTLCRFLKLVLTHNLIDFNNSLHLQINGLGMGFILSPPASNGVMKFVVCRINTVCLQRKISLPVMDSRFMDDRLHLLNETTDYDEYQSICDSGDLKFTTDGPPAQTKDFLDLNISLQNGKLETKLYRNPVSKSNFYLNFFSSHPSCTRKSIPYSLALRIKRNCSLESSQTEFLEELSTALVSNSFYPPDLVTSAFEKVKILARTDLLTEKTKEPCDDLGRSVLSTPFHPSLKSLPRILRLEACALRGLDPTFDLLTSPPPLVAWNRAKTLKQSIAPSKLRSDSDVGGKPGTYKCDRKKCSCCLDVLETRRVTINNISRRILGKNNCDTKWLVYALNCTTCNIFYIGKTYTSFKVRWSNHKSKLNKVLNSGSDSLADESVDGDIHLLQHFSRVHTNLTSLKWVILHNIGKIEPDPAGNLLRWEHAYIDHFNCMFPNGLNKRE
jgi:hypothetical protein